jgi:hypothetical protein
MSKDTEIPLLLSSALALAGLGVSVGSQFQITPWVLLCWSGAGLLLIVWLQRHGPASATRHPARVFLIGTLLLSVGLVLAWWLLPKPLSVMGRSRNGETRKTDHRCKYFDNIAICLRGSHFPKAVIGAAALMSR